MVTYKRYQQPSGHWHERNHHRISEQLNLVFVSDEEKIRPLVFITKAEERKAAFQENQFKNFNRLVNTRAYGQQALSKHKPEKTLARIEKKVNNYIKLTTAKLFGEQKKYLNAKNELPTNRKLYQISLFLMKKTFSRQRRNRRISIGPQRKAPRITTLEHHEPEVFFQN